MANTTLGQPQLLPAEESRPPILLCEADRAWGSIVLLHEGFGLNPFTWGQTARFAAAGLHVAAPALFWRQNTLSIPYEAEAEAARLARAADPAELLADVGVARRMLAAQRGPVMLAGWCFGGMAACLATLAGAEGFAAVVAWYPVRLRALVEARPEGRCRAPLMVLLGTQDRFVPETEQDWIAAWAERQPACALVRYPGVDHGFCNVDRTDLYDGAAADASWDRALAHLRRHAGPGAQ